MVGRTLIVGLLTNSSYSSQPVYLFFGMTMIFKRLKSYGILPVCTMSVKKCANHTFVYLPLFKRNPEWTLSNPWAFPGFTYLSAVENSSGVKGRKYSGSVASAFRVLCSRATLIVCGLSFSTLDTATRFEAIVLWFVVVLSLNIGVLFPSFLNNAHDCLLDVRKSKLSTVYVHFSRLAAPRL